MSPAEAEFWREMERYHDLAEQFETHIEITHPRFVTSDRVACPFCYRCRYGATTVTYYEYRGPKVLSA